MEAYLFFSRPMASLLSAGDKYSCPFCKHSFSRFIPSGIKADVLTQNQVIGAGYRKNAICPSCLSTDRERLVYLFLQERKLLVPSLSILHIAPERNLKRVFKEKGLQCVFADKESPSAPVKMDVQTIPFPNNSFDAIICNHVLEHVANDRQAMNELHRVLKPNGWAILQVPYSPIVGKTLEDPTCTSPKSREKQFGQSDHVRLYGRDYVDRLKESGFIVQQETVHSGDAQRYALNPREKVFFLKK